MVRIQDSHVGEIARAKGRLHRENAAAAPNRMLESPYFNELAGGPRDGFQHLLDSNLDHGQDLKYLKSYMESHGIKKIQLAYYGHVWPQMYGIDFEPLGRIPKPGPVEISASYLQGQSYLMTYLPPRPVFIEAGYFRAMQKYAPQAQVGHSIFVYDVPAG